MIYCNEGNIEFQGKLSTLLAEYCVTTAAIYDEMLLRGNDDTTALKFITEAYMDGIRGSKRGTNKC